MDHVAHALGMDPLVVRQRNFYAEAAGGCLPAAPPESISGKVKDEGRAAPAGEPDLASRGAPAMPAAAAPAVPAGVQTHPLRPAGRGFLPARAGRPAGRKLGLPCPPPGGGGMERGQPGAETRHRADAGQVRHLVHAHPSEPGRGAGACLSGRLDPDEPWRHRDGPGPVPQGGAGRRGAVRGRYRPGADHRHRYRQGAQYLGHRGVFGVGSERHGGAGRLRHHPRPAGGVPGRTAAGPARGGGVRGRPHPRRRRRDRVRRGGEACLREPHLAVLDRVLPHARRSNGTVSPAAAGRSTTSPMAPR